MPPGAAETTTLLVCPYVRCFGTWMILVCEVKAWEAYEAFRDFYEDELVGNIFLEELGMKIVAFHPYLKPFGSIW